MTNDVIEYRVEVYSNGTQNWRLGGKLHREDGPAIITHEGILLWYLYGDLVTEEEHVIRTNPTKDLTIAEIEALLGHKVKIVKG